jgi:TonB family protein
LRGTTVVITSLLSVALHIGLATGLVAVAQKRELKRRAISVAVTEEKKKAKDKPKPPPPPKPIVHAAPPKVVAVAKAAPVAAVAHVAAAPMATNLSMSNAGLDIGPGIGLQGRAQPAPAAAPLKTASAVSERRTNRTKEEAGAGTEAPCEEEPTKPEAVVKTELNYTLYPQAQADGVEGKFKARLIVDASGEVSKVEVVTSIEPAFDAAIVAALQRWRFKPAMACGKPVSGGTFIVSRVFELGD